MFKNFLLKNNTKPIPKVCSTSITDNQAYPQVCIQASQDYRLFDTFRSNPIYIETLEHVSQEHGRAYLEFISKDADIFASIDTFKANDNFGTPLRYEYPQIGKIAPTTLRYIKVLTDTKRHFQSLDGLDICEIGVGYGGQCRVINAYFKPANYCLVDIKPALALSQRFLDNFIINSTLRYKTMNELAEKEYDLVISNYAFSELRREIQDVYLHKIILNSKRGYMICNDIAPQDFNSYKSDELLSAIPGAKILKEEPLTHRRNYVIVWGAES